MSAANRNSRTHLRIAVADTVLDCNDSGGNGHPIIFLNGAFGSQRDWEKALSKLDRNYRTITYDERARGKSKKSKNYSFSGCLEDLSAVVTATGVQRPILVGWSLGAAIAVRYAADHPDDTAALLLIDGAYPISTFSDADKEHIRRAFQKMALLLPIAAVFGKAARMSASQAASLNIELHDILILRNIGPVYDGISCPVYFISASKRSMGRTEEHLRAMRASIDALVAQHPNVSIYRTLPCTHANVLSKHPGAIAAAIADLCHKSDRR
jgi:pimeloyl-ACP methyl ester carboxylesterase